MKMIFYGFRHGHIYGLYRKAKADEKITIEALIEDNAEARATAEGVTGEKFSDVSYDEWLKKDIDAVAIGGAYGDRGQAIIKALKAGKHVIADKPICTRLSELEEIRRLSREKNLAVMCMLDLRYIPSMVTADELIKSKKLGEIKNISFTGQHCIDLDHRPHWYFEEGMHGGTINDLAIHGIDLMLCMTGLTVEKTDFARTWNSFATPYPFFRDCAVFALRLSNGAEVMADVSYSAPHQVFSMPTYWNFKIWCEKGLVAFALKENAVTVYEDGCKEPYTVEGKVTDRTWFSDFLDEIESGNRENTESVLASTECALKIQAEADKQ